MKRALITKCKKKEIIYFLLCIIFFTYFKTISIFTDAQGGASRLQGSASIEEEQLRGSAGSVEFEGNVEEEWADEQQQPGCNQEVEGEGGEGSREESGWAGGCVHGGELQTRVHPAAERC